MGVDLFLNSVEDRFGVDTFGERLRTAGVREIYFAFGRDRADKNGQECPCCGRPLVSIISAVDAALMAGGPWREFTSVDLDFSVC